MAQASARVRPGARSLLRIEQVLEGRLDPVGHGLQGGDADRTFFACLEQSRKQFLPFEALAAAVLLHDHVRDLVDPLVTREAAATSEALAAPPDHLAFLAFPRVDDLVAEVGAVGA